MLCRRVDVSLIDDVPRSRSFLKKKTRRTVTVATTMPLDDELRARSPKLGRTSTPRCLIERVNPKIFGRHC